MKQLKLDVVRFENEDVIATSTCAYLEAPNHVYISAFNSEQIIDTFYTYSNGGLKQTGTVNYVTSKNSDPSMYQLALDQGINGTGWYYYDTNTGKFVHCTSQSNEAHPTVQ